MERLDVIVIGAGAAGLFAGVEAARRGRSVVVIEHNRAPAEKIRISGGGRCNFTNLDIRPEAYLSENPKFPLSALKRYTQWDFIARLDQAGISWHEKTLGQLFCDGSARQIVAMLVDDLDAAGGVLRLGEKVTSVGHNTAGFEVRTDAATYHAASLVVATGGKSIPKMGATGFAYHLADQFGVARVPTRAGLVPLTFGPEVLARTSPLAGLATKAIVRCGPSSFEEGLLFTHRGLSGPSILQISSYWREGADLAVDFLAGQAPEALIDGWRRGQGGQKPVTVLSGLLPRRLAEMLCADLTADRRIADLTGPEIAAWAQRLSDHRFRPNGSEGYRTAEVTLGGVSTAALDAKTMQVRAVPGLYFIGEAVDVTGWLGGYNFQWAWSSGWAAGQVV